MNKKIMLLALGAVSAAAFTAPATASAELESLHMNPTPAKIDIAGGATTLRGNLGNITCAGVKGTMTPEAGGTTGTLGLTFGPNCRFGGSAAQPCTSSDPAEPQENISTTVLPYHLVTIDNGTPTAPSAGVLVTPGANSTFAHFNCTILGFPIQITLEGRGLLGTITAPACGAKAIKAVVSFKAVAGTTHQQHSITHNKVSTKTTIAWSLSQGGNPASLETTATLTATNVGGVETETELVCT